MKAGVECRIYYAWDIGVEGGGVLGEREAAHVLDRYAEIEICKAISRLCKLDEQSIDLLAGNIK